MLIFKCRGSRIFSDFFSRTDLFIKLIKKCPEQDSNSVRETLLKCSKNIFTQGSLSLELKAGSGPPCSYTAARSSVRVVPGSPHIPNRCLVHCVTMHRTSQAPNCLYIVTAHLPLPRLIRLPVTIAIWGNGSKSTRSSTVT